MEQFERHAHFGAKAEEAGERGGHQPGGHQEQEAVGQWHQAIANHDICLANGVVGGHKFGAESQLAAELGSRGLFSEERVGAALEDRAVDGFGGQRAAQAGTAFKERVLDRFAGGARLFEFKGSRHSRDAAADDRYPH